MNDTYHLSGLRPMEIEMIRAEVRGQSIPKRALRNGDVGRADASHDFFTIRTGNDWLAQQAQQPKAQMLFGEFWYQNEICILFADTNVGKSVLAVQIGNSLSRLDPIAPFGLEADACAVLYVDFELSAQQFEARYTHRGQQFMFAQQFYRAEISPDFNAPNNTEKPGLLVEKALEYGIKKTEASVLIIDNLTSLRTGTEKAGEALPLMKHLKALKSKYNLSILVLAHTPKRNPALPLGRNDLQGSKMLINFCDSAFAIGESATRPGTRFLKQIKQRYGTETYGTNHVALMQLIKDDSFLQYRFLHFDREANHLRRRSQQEREQLALRINQLHQQGHSQRQISRQTGASLTRVNSMIVTEKGGEGSALAQPALEEGINKPFCHPER
jgi:RecA-family ATPase